MTGEHAEHFALVRQVNAETGHIPQAVIDLWQESGPLRVRRALADHVRQWADQGLIRAEVPERTAVHLMLLISAANPSYPGAVPSEDEISETVTSGVRAFLHGYLR